MAVKLLVFKNQKREGSVAKTLVCFGFNQEHKCDRRSSAYPYRTFIAHAWRAHVLGFQLPRRRQLPPP
jgi:hypothetical protein